MAPVFDDGNPTHPNSSAGVPGPQRRRARTIVSAAAAVTMTLVSCTSPTFLDGAGESTTVVLDASGASGGSDDTSRTVTVPVYWTGSGDSTQQLFRESLTVQGSGTADPIGTAVQAMTQATPDEAEQRTLWRPVSGIGTSYTEDTITVDLPAAAVSRHLERLQARLAIQQLTNTAVAAAIDAGLADPQSPPAVRILVDGAGDATAFGSYRVPDQVSYVEDSADNDVKTTSTGIQAMGPTQG
ncbi:hypothetical protein GWK18_00470 [Kocuria sp. JC486]|uniref:GerMN domain-containing protein n=1 Tax=Kocuria sp. JC486 TaxID=1970736 RepID=UPI001423D30F|nr:hypothetical protein [Kocuria sp. JC486]